MTLRLNGATSGYVEIDCPAAGGNNTLVLPTSNGSAGNILGTDGAGNLSWVNGRMVLETAKASTSGTFVDFTGIPSWVKRVTVMFNGVSTNGTSSYQIQAGTSGGVVATGYLGASSDGPALAATLFTTGIGIRTASAAAVVHGAVVFNNVTGNTWTANGSLARSDLAVFISTAGSVTLSGTLTQLRITTVNGTDTFDAGSINILYEG